MTGWLDTGPRRWTDAIARWGAREPDAPSDAEPSAELANRDETAAHSTSAGGLALVCEPRARDELAPDAHRLRVLTPSELAALVEPGTATSIEGIILDLRGVRVRRFGGLKRCAERETFARVPTVALIGSAEDAKQASALRVTASVSCEGDPRAALDRAVRMCAALTSAPLPDVMAYAGLAAAHRELREMHRHLRVRTDEDELRGAMIVHDLRSPLGVVHGATSELLLDLPEGPERELVSLAVSALHQLEGLVDRLEQLYAGAGRPSRPERVDLAALAEGVADGLRYAPAARGKTLVVRCSGPAYLLADRQDLVRVLSNLIGNALRHARTEVEVVVRACEHEVVAQVRDDGTGLPEALREGLFARSSRKPGAGRMGLGLAIVQRAVMRHEGRVHALDRSEHEGVPGACFVVRLPARATDSEPAQARVTS